MPGCRNIANYKCVHVRSYVSGMSLLAELEACSKVSLLHVISPSAFREKFYNRGVHNPILAYPVSPDYGNFAAVYSQFL